MTGNPLPAEAARGFENPAAGVRMIPNIGDDDLMQAVLMARAVVRLDELRWKHTVRLAELEQRIKELEASVRSGEAARRRLAGRLSAVQAVHSEADEAACGDGCCHESLGVCRKCGEPYPCTTIQAVNGQAGERPSMV